MVGMRFLLGCVCASSLVMVVTSSCTVDKWGDWSTCSKSCDSGLQSREGTDHGDLCKILEVSCNIMPCDDPFAGRTWTVCNETCGGGTRWRDDADGNTQSIRCNTQMCDENPYDCVSDVVFVLDSSGSMGRFNWTVVKQFVIDVIKGLKVSEEDTHVGIVTFSTEVERNYELQTITADNVEDVFSLRYLAGVTNTADAIAAMVDMFNSGRPLSETKRIAVVITDGASNVDQPRTIPEAETAMASGITIYSVGIGTDLDEDEIYGISYGDQYIFMASDFDAVQTLTNAIAEEICIEGCTSETSECGDFDICNATSCGAPGTKRGSRQRWLVCGRDGQELEGSRTNEACTATCTMSCRPECGSCEQYGECDGDTCGGEGHKTGSKACFQVNTETNQKVPGSDTRESCTETCTVSCPTLPPGTPDCTRCDYTHGQIWLEDNSNCHMYYICELRYGHFRVHHATCGKLYWSKTVHTCVAVLPADASCNVGPVIPYQQANYNNYAVDCVYEPYPGDASKYWIPEDEATIRQCGETMIFFNVDNLCDCLPVTGVTSCSDDLLLHFPYDDHYDDVTCNHAIATRYGDGVSLEDDDIRGKVACFTGDTYFEVSFVRMWFANNKVDQFTAAVWLKRTGTWNSEHKSVVFLADCTGFGAYGIYASDEDLGVKVVTEDADVAVDDWYAEDQWVHVALVYNGTELALYVDKELASSSHLTGYMVNTDLPMTIAACCEDYFFIGCLDDLRIYKTALTATEIMNLP